jgi:hypothetical protein
MIPLGQPILIGLRESKSALAKACDYTLRSLESAPSLLGISGVGIEQQFGRERDAPGRPWPAQWIHVGSQEAAEPNFNW